jgi:hypothetical protein
MAASGGKLLSVEITRRFRDAGVFVCSAAVLALLGLYAVAGGGIRLAAVADRVVREGGAGVVVSGRVVDEHGKGVGHALVLVAASGRQPTQALSGQDGLFRLGLSGACARYEIRLAARVQARTLQARLKRTLCPGQLLRVRARVVSSSQFLWMPR